MLQQFVTLFAAPTIAYVALAVHAGEVGAVYRIAGDRIAGETYCDDGSSTRNVMVRPSGEDGMVVPRGSTDARGRRGLASVAAGTNWLRFAEHDASFVCIERTVCEAAGPRVPPSAVDPAEPAARSDDTAPDMAALQPRYLPWLPMALAVLFILVFILCLALPWWNGKKGPPHG